MKKIIVAMAVITVVLVLMVINVAGAFATVSSHGDWYFDIQTTDNQTFEVVFVDNDDTLVTNGYTFYLEYCDSYTGANPIITPHEPAGMMPVSTNIDTDNGAINFTALSFTSSTLGSSTGTICTIEFDSSYVPGNLIWGLDELSFKVNVGLSNPVTGQDLYIAGNLNPTSSPTPCVPEIATIVLLSIGLLSLGGFAWFKKRKQTVEVA